MVSELENHNQKQVLLKYEFTARGVQGQKMSPWVTGKASSSWEQSEPKKKKTLDTTNTDAATTSKYSLRPSI